MDISTEILHTFLVPGAWLALLTLAFMEVVLGIDNIVFLSVMTARLAPDRQPHARVVGLMLAMVARIGLLFGVSMLMRLTAPIVSFAAPWVSGTITGQGMIVLAGGVFLLYKSVMEIHHKLEGHGESGHRGKTVHAGFWGIIAQIVVLDVVFSFDSVLTAVGMVSFTEYGYAGAMAIMVVAIVAAVMTMLMFSGPISRFVNTHPTIQMLAYSFLILIAVMLLVEAAHLSGLVLLGNPIGEIPKGYIYFAIAFSLLVEVLNMRLAGRRRKKQSR